MSQCFIERRVSAGTLCVLMVRRGNAVQCMYVNAARGTYSLATHAHSRCIIVHELFELVQFPGRKGYGFS